MYSLSFVAKHLTLILVLVAIQILICRVSSLNTTNAYLNHKCFTNQGKYKSGSGYEKLLKNLIGRVSDADFRMGYSESMRSDADGNLVSLILQCRGDTFNTKCRSCFNIALAELQKRCHSYKRRTIWYDQCLLDISSLNTIGKIDLDNSFCMSNSKNVTGDPHALNMKWLEFSGDLVSNATRKNNRVNGVWKLYAAEKSKFGKEEMYGMVQCTEDISNKACKVCVSQSLRNFQNCWKGKHGARVFGRSCGFRFEFYPFVR